MKKVIITNDPSNNGVFKVILREGFFKKSVVTVRFAEAITLAYSYLTGKGCMRNLVSRNPVKKLSRWEMEIDEPNDIFLVKK